MDINLFGLRIFVMVAEKKSFSEAARSLYLTQPAVTHQVKNLESYFATPLFKRESNTVLLTPAGKILYKYAKRFWTPMVARKKRLLVSPVTPNENKSAAFSGLYKSVLVSPTPSLQLNSP